MNNLSPKSLGYTTLQIELMNSFLEYFNDYLTIAKFAEHKGVSVACASAVIKEGRALHEEYVALYKLLAC